MTPSLKGLLSQFGQLTSIMCALDAARTKWANELGPILSEEELAALPIGDKEPIIVVRAPKGQAEWEISKPSEHDFVDEKTGARSDVSIWDLPEDEFFYFKAFRQGIVQFSGGMPQFIHGMALVYAYSLFENYLANAVKAIFIAHPERLGRAKQLNYGDILDHGATKEKLIEMMASKQIQALFYRSIRDILGLMRRQYGFRELSTLFDQSIVRASLMRNILLHNDGIIDERLEEESNGKYKSGDQLVLEQGDIFILVNAFMKLAVEVDKQLAHDS